MLTDAAETAIYGIRDARGRNFDERPCRQNQTASASPSADIVGTSKALRMVLWYVNRVAATDSTVLITGETGTGKELVARAIHKASTRSSQPFVSVNCAAIPQSLIAAELFGYEQGAFTGALRRRHGRFEVADRGTLFLDEVGELPVETQITLLRVLQEREFERVGGTSPIPANVRVVAATNCDLAAAIDAKKFRNDLFYRLNVFPIAIPPLRERREDIAPLAEFFVERYARRAEKTIRGISEQTIAALEVYPWPGNVRELQNVIERAIILCDSDVLSIDEAWLRSQPPRSATMCALHVERPAAQVPVRSQPIDASPTLADMQREAIIRALQTRKWRVGGPNGAASSLGLARTTLQSHMRKLGIVSPRSRGRE